jgi:hypothetical protein
MTVIGGVLDARKIGPKDQLMSRLAHCDNLKLLRRATALAATSSSIDRILAELWPD